MVNKNRNQGFSLVEILISLTILSIVGLILFSFLAVSSKTFRSVNTEVNLQYEAQLTINQLKDLMVDSNRGIVYGLQPNVGSFTPVDLEDAASQQILLQSLEAADVSNVGSVKRCLFIYNETYLAPTDPTATGTYEYPVIKIIWDPQTQELQYAQKTFPSIPALEADQYLNSLLPGEYYLMSEYADNFSVFMTDTDKKTFTIQLDLENAGKKYTTTPSIALRNKVVVSGDLQTVYTPVGITRPSLINGVVIKKAGAVITSDSVSIGTVIQYEADVDVQFGASAGSESVQWILTGNATYGSGTPTKLLSTGELQVSQYELASQLTLTAVSVTDSTKKAVILVTVTDSRGEFGYVNSLALGDIKYGDRPESTAIGGPYAYYGVNYQDNSSYISYVNESEIPTAEKGVTWNITTNAPAESYCKGVLPAGDTSYGLLAASPVYIGVNYLANGYTFHITATTKSDNYEGTKISVSKEFTVSGLQEPIVEIPYEILLNITDGTKMSRNGKLKFISTVTGVYNKTTTMEIVAGSGFDENTITKKFDNVTLTKLSQDGEYELIADKELDWNTEFSFTVKMHVTGVTNKGTPVDKTIIKTIAISKVGVTISPKPTSVKYGLNAVSLPAPIGYTNLTIGTDGVEPDFIPGSVSMSEIYYSYRFKKTNYNNWLNGAYVIYNTGNIILTKPLMEYLYYLVESESYGLTFDTTISSGANSITIQDTKITFYP